MSTMITVRLLNSLSIFILDRRKLIEKNTCNILVCVQTSPISFVARDVCTQESNILVQVRAFIIKDVGIELRLCTV